MWYFYYSHILDLQSENEKHPLERLLSIGAYVLLVLFRLLSSCDQKYAHSGSQCRSWDGKHSYITPLRSSNMLAYACFVSLGFLRAAWLSSSPNLECDRQQSPSLSILCSPAQCIKISGWARSKTQMISTTSGLRSFVPDWQSNWIGSLPSLFRSETGALWRPSRNLTTA